MTFKVIPFMLLVLQVYQINCGFGPSINYVTCVEEDVTTEFGILVQHQTQGEVCYQSSEDTCQKYTRKQDGKFTISAAYEGNCVIQHSDKDSKVELVAGSYPLITIESEGSCDKRSFWFDTGDTTQSIEILSLSCAEL